MGIFSFLFGRKSQNTTPVQSQANTGNFTGLFTHPPVPQQMGTGTTPHGGWLDAVEDYKTPSTSLEV